MPTPIKAYLTIENGTGVISFGEGNKVNGV